MIQRIQTLFLVIAFISTTFLGFSPILRFTPNNPKEGPVKEIFAFKSTGLVSDAKAPSPGLKIILHGEPYSLPNLLVWILVEILIVFSIFQFKSRIFQMRLIWVSIGLILVLSILIYLDINHSGDATAPRNLEPGAYTLSASLLLLLMARRQIQKDEILVKSIDRLR